MDRDARYIWNRQLHIGVSQGGLPPSLLRDRTINLIYTDRLRNFDHIEWILDNWDGAFTKLENLLAGLVVQIRIGYLDGAFPWRSFVINRVRGGVGVANKARPMVGDNERKLIYYGRNRNAPGGGRPTKMSWSRTAKPPPKRNRTYPPTEDIAGRDMVLRMNHPRTVEGATLYEIVSRIAERNGFTGAYAKIEPSADPVMGGAVTIPEGLSDGQFLERLARMKGWVFKVDEKGLHFYSATWAGTKRDVLPTIVYGAGNDIITLDIDGDFRLPLPSNVKAKAWDPDTRAMIVADLKEMQYGSHAVNVSVVYERIYKEQPQTWKALSREETVVALGHPGSVSERAKARFLARHLRAFQLNVRTVGNPAYLAGKLLPISGTGSPFVDGLWLIDEVRHIYSPETYVTELHLKQPPRREGLTGGDRLAPFIIYSPNYSRAQGKPSLSAGYIRNPGNWIQEEAPPSLRGGT